MMPFSPRARERTAAESVTMEKTISDSRATSRGESAQSMPTLNMGAAFSLVRFQPVTEWPAASKRGTIARPMSPRPRKPIFKKHLSIDAKNARKFNDKAESLLPEFHDGGVAEVFLGGALNEVVRFASGGSCGQSDAELIGEVEREAKILVHEAQRETRNVFALEQIGGFDVEDAGASHAGLHDFDKFFALDAGACRQRESFGERADLERKDHVHRELDSLTSAVRAEVKPFLAHYTEYGLGFFQRLGIAADHEDELAFFGAPVTTRDGSIQETSTTLAAGGGNLAGERRRNGAGIYVNAAALQRLHGAVRTPQHCFQRGGIADHGEEKVRISGDLVR